MKNQVSFWETDAPPASADFGIIGGGLVGQSIALFLKKAFPDCSVLILERGSRPMGASTRNAGFGCIGSVTEHLSDIRTEGEETVYNRIQNRFEGLQLLRETLGDEFIDWDSCGGYEIFLDDDEYRKAAAFLPKLNAQIASVVGVEQAYYTTHINGYPAVAIDLEGGLHPGKMMHRLSQLNNAAGVSVIFNAEVLNLSKDDGSVATQSGNFKFGHVFVATNGFTSKLLPETGIKPARGQVFITHPIENLQWKGTFHYDYGFYYFRNVGNCFLIGGARNEDVEGETTFDFGENPAVISKLTEFCNTVLKLPQPWSIAQSWSGIMGFAPQKTAVCKQISDTYTVVAGLSGMGVALGMKLAKEAVSRIR